MTASHTPVGLGWPEGQRVDREAAGLGWPDVARPATGDDTRLAPALAAGDAVPEAQR